MQMDMASDMRDSRTERGRHGDAGHDGTAGVATMLLTDKTLGDITFALRTSLGRVGEEEMTSPMARAQWHDVQQWLDEAEAFRRADPDASQLDFVRLRSFPLTGTQLRTLQVEVDLAEARRAAQSAMLTVAVARHRPVPPPPHDTVEHVRTSSIALAGVLFLSLIINISWLALSRLGIIVVPHLTLILGVNSLVSILTVSVWAVHHWQILGHLRAVHWHLPAQLGNPLHLWVR